MSVRIERFNSSLRTRGSDHIELWEPLDVTRGWEACFASTHASNAWWPHEYLHPTGTGLHQVPISPSCGGAASDPTSRGCLEPAWSPDGTKIVFHIFAPGIKVNNPIYTANADGSGLFQVTHTGAMNSGEGDAVPDWGTHAVTG